MKSTEKRVVEEILLNNKEVLSAWRLIYEVHKNKAGNKYQEARKEFAEFLQRVVGNYIQEQFGKNKAANRLLAMAFDDMDFIEIANEIIVSSLFEGESR